MRRARGGGEKKRAVVTSGAGMTRKPGRSRLGRDQHLRKSEPQPARRPARSPLRAAPARVRCLPRCPPPPRSLASWEPLAGRDPSSSCRAAAAAAAATVTPAAAARAARR